MDLVVVVGTRPNYMKAGPLVRAARRRTGVRITLVHTGQHYDPNMSDLFFEELDLPRPDVHFGVGSGTHALQTAAIMTAFDGLLESRTADAVAVVGDVNSTMACALVAAKREIPVAHVEAGLRSFDRSMPEEVNRVVTDALSDWCLTPSPDADENLLAEGVAPERIFLVGNVMIDSLLGSAERARDLGVAGRLSVEGPYIYATLHRPSNVDDEETLRGLCRAFRTISADAPIILPLHPRTKARLDAFDLWGELGDRVLWTEPVGYLESLNLMMHAHAVLTDSGGIQEETTALGVPCLTLRVNTERPITVLEGTNTVVGNDPDDIVAAYRSIDRTKPLRRPALWDGRTADRMLDVLVDVPPPLRAATRVELSAPEDELVARIRSGLAAQKLPPAGSRVLFVGVGNGNRLRVQSLLRHLVLMGVDAGYHDPALPELLVHGRHMRSMDLRGVDRAHVVVVLGRIGAETMDDLHRRATHVIDAAVEPTHT